MDKYLLEILKNANTIIIPGLGALTITNHDTGEIMFMSYLKHDDGKLASYIVENEGIAELDAKNLIAKYVREIELTVGKGETYDMFQFGSFFKNGDEIDFKNWEGDKTATKIEVEEETVVAPIVEETPIVEEKVETPITPEAEEIEEIIPPKVEETLDEKPVIEEKAEPVVLHLKEEEPKEKTQKELNILEKEERAATAAKLDALKKKQEAKKEKKKKGVGFWMLIVLLALIVSGGTYFGLNYNELKQHIPFLADASTGSETASSTGSATSTDKDATDKNDDSTNETEDSSTEEIESEIIEEEIPEQIEPEQNPVNSSNNTDLPFHIIAGAFGSEENANRLGEKLKAEGYSVKVGPGAGMTLVSIKSFATRAEAQAGLNEVKSVAPKGWVYEWR